MLSLFVVADSQILSADVAFVGEVIAWGEDSAFRPRRPDSDTQQTVSRSRSYWGPFVSAQLMFRWGPPLADCQQQDLFGLEVVQMRSERRQD